MAWRATLVRTAKQRAAILSRKASNRALIPPKPDPPAESWWTRRPAVGFTDAAKGEVPRMQASPFGRVHVWAKGEVER